MVPDTFFPSYGISPRKTRRSTVLTENVYEGMFILDSGRYGHDPEGVSGQVNEMIQKLGGSILVSRLWDERRLAYPIKSHRKGTYWLTYFRLPGPQLGTLKRECQINETILRVLFLKIDPRLVDAVVAHAQSAPAVAPPEEAVAAAAPAVAVDIDLKELEVPELDEEE
jgi:small subunit ribosomal protein S6